MNRLTYFLLLSIPLLIQEPVSAQQKFSDGEITYDVQVDLPPGTPAQNAAALAGSRLIYSFKNYLFRSDIYFGKTTYTNIHNSRDHSAVTLITTGPNKYLIRMNEADLAKESARYDGVTFTDEGSEKKIAGYNCRKAMGKLKDGSTFTVYYTPDLIPEDMEYNARFKGLKGLPLAFEMTTSHHLKMTMTASNVVIGPQPSVKFRTPVSGYREITYNELENLRKANK